MMCLFLSGYINLNDACLSNSDLSTSATTTTTTTTKMPKTSSDRKAIAKENPNSFHHGASIFHCRSSQNGESTDVNDRISSTFDYFDNLDNNSSGRQSRFEYCNSYSNLNQFASSTTATTTASSSSSNRNRKSSTDATNFDFQSEENLFNMNFDSFYEDFVDSADFSWSSTSSASSTSYDSSSISSMYDKKYVILPEIKLDNDLMRLDKADEKALMVAGKQEEPVAENHHSSGKEATTNGKLRCFHCNKKLGIIMIMKCHCNQYFCAAHRFMEVHNCSYDYKEHGRKKLERENPLICTQKLPKI
jgi:AN1-like Zinc finger